MDRKAGILIVLGLAIGAVFGAALGTGMDNTPLPIALGALGGVFVGWFAAAAHSEKGEG